MKTIDLRSDTVTRPSPAMRQAIANAEVGDDVYGEDPTVNRLQQTAARLLGKEQALFVPSGTMGNSACLRALSRPGDVVLAGWGAHILLYEGGAAAGLHGLQIETLGTTGLFEPDDVIAAMVPEDPHLAYRRVLSVENTHNRGGGRIFPYEQLVKVTETARDCGLQLHLDGARIFNAVVATGVSAESWAKLFDSVTFCLSKGLGAPVGSLVCGSAELIRSVHRARKMLGGSMRQVGLLAAAGLYALEHHIERLADDHANARRLAIGLEKLGFRVDPAPETNMVMFQVGDTQGFMEALRIRELLINPMALGLFRAVTHLDVSEADIDEALGRIEEIVREGVPPRGSP